jgi:hemerythrin-like domain-containing protein
MERSEMLKSLSHDHHQALRVCQLMRRCDVQNASETRDAFVRFWQPHQIHIRIEEDVLFPKFAEFGGADHPMIERALAEHTDDGALARQVIESAEPPVETMHELAERLHDHVRFEERELFPEIERTVPESERAALLAALAHAETRADWQPGRQH